jgi:hypothetical protein
MSLKSGFRNSAVWLCFILSSNAIFAIDSVRAQCVPVLDLNQKSGDKLGLKFKEWRTGSISRSGFDVDIALARILRGGANSSSPTDATISEILDRRRRILDERAAARKSKDFSVHVMNESYAESPNTTISSSICTSMKGLVCMKFI